MPGSIIPESGGPDAVTEDGIAGGGTGERTGRSVFRGGFGQTRDTETTQLPSPGASPRSGTFPSLEITVPPVPPLTPLHENGDSDGADAEHDPDMSRLKSERSEDKEGASASGTSTSASSYDSSSSSAIEDEPEESSSRQISSQSAGTKPRTQSTTKKETTEGPRKLSASEMKALTSSPDTLPVAIVPSQTTVSGQRKPNGNEYPMSASIAESASRPSMAEQLMEAIQTNAQNTTPTPIARNQKPTPAANSAAPRSSADFGRRPASSRTLSTPPINRRSSTGTFQTAPRSTRRNSYNPGGRPPPLDLGTSSNMGTAPQRAPMAYRAVESDRQGDYIERHPDATIKPPSIPLPPMSLHTHLQLELAGVRPSPLYIYRGQGADEPYESSAVKFERLTNALLLPPYLEGILGFGALACLDAFLYTFTLLPMRFCIALGVLVKWWGYIIGREVTFVVGFVYYGLGRLWKRGRRGRSLSRTHLRKPDSSQAPSEVDRSQSRVRENGYASDATVASVSESARLNGNGVMRPPKHALPFRATPTGFRHRRTKSMPSDLTSFHKADLLQGLVLICSSFALMNIDASRMYHFIRAQSAMKLYVIFNTLEVFDRLLAAIGQDILECLFSTETLSRNSFGRSKLLLPFGMFLLTLVYNVIHALCLFYMVITMNVAVNSYSNALLTLLISNQFVEIKGAVFKRIEKENLFQMTCSDVVERFQLWIYLTIIGMRNIVEVGGLSVPGAGAEADAETNGPGPIHTASNLPMSFTMLPSWLISGEVLSPFLIVIGSEMLVDWIKHAYVNKFNSVKPRIYSRMLDIFCKDYYTNAFGASALTRRIGLPLLPLSCLFIRASVQIYQMFLATHLPPPIPTSTTELSLESSTPTSPVVIAALERFDSVIRNALGRAVYGYPYASPHVRPFWAFTSDDAIALLTMVFFFSLAWLILLVVKLILGMALLKFSHNRYIKVQMHEQSVNEGKEKRESFYQPGKRIGSWGQVEVGDERRKMIYADDPEGLRRMREREKKGEEMKSKMEIGKDGLERVTRYEMISKRIW